MQIQELTMNNYARLDRFHAARSRLMLLGPAGAGKSTIIEGYTKAKQLGYVEIIVSQIEAFDVRGIMVPHRVEGRLPDTVSTRSPIATLVEREIANGHTRGVLFLDEYYQGGLDVRKAFTQFMTSYRIGDWELPEGWVIWGASNPASWRAGTSAPMGHEPSRWTPTLDVEPDPASWQRWANSAGIHHLYSAFANHLPDEVFSINPPADRGSPHCNPRSLVAAHDFHTLGVQGNELPIDPVTQECVAGAIGHGAANALFGFLQVQDVMPSPEEMLANPTTCKIPPPERIDARFASMMQAVHHAGPERNEALFEFVRRMGKEMALTSIKHFAAKDPLSLNAPNIVKFMTENAVSTMALAGVN